MRIALIILLIILFSCESEQKQECYECKECMTVILYNGVEKDRTIGFYCGTELEKQERANYKEINNNQVIEIRTTCTKSNIKQ